MSVETLMSKALGAAVAFINESPCDPDITPQQYAAYKEYIKAMADLGASETADGGHALPTEPSRNPIERERSAPPPDADPNDRLEQEIRERVAAVLEASVNDVGVIVGTGVVLVKVRPEYSNQYHTGTDFTAALVQRVLVNMGIKLYHVL